MAAAPADTERADIAAAGVAASFLALADELEEGSASIRVLGGGYTLAVDAKYAVDWQVTCTPS